MLGKINEPLKGDKSKVLQDSESLYTLYHVSNVIIQDFILTIAWCIIHIDIALAFFRTKFKV